MGITIDNAVVFNLTKIVHIQKAQTGNTIYNAVKCNLTKLTTKSEVGAAVIMVSDI